MMLHLTLLSKVTIASLTCTQSVCLARSLALDFLISFAGIRETLPMSVLSIRAALPSRMYHSALHPASGVNLPDVIHCLV